jgi:hypothetical protein
MLSPGDKQFRDSRHDYFEVLVIVSGRRFIGSIGDAADFNERDFIERGGAGSPAALPGDAGRA